VSLRFVSLDAAASAIKDNSSVIQHVLTLSLEWLRFWDPCYLGWSFWQLGKRLSI